MSTEAVNFGRRGRRSRFSALEKKRIVEETYEQGSVNPPLVELL